MGRLDGCGSAAAAAAAGIGVDVGVGVGIGVNVGSYRLDIWPILRACMRTCACTAEHEHAPVLDLRVFR